MTWQVCFDVQDLKAYGVNTLVRVCAATYDKAPVEQEGIQVLVSDIHGYAVYSFTYRQRSESFRDWMEEMFSKISWKGLFIYGDFDIDLLNRKINKKWQKNSSTQCTVWADLHKLLDPVEWHPTVPTKIFTNEIENNTISTLFTVWW